MGKSIKNYDWFINWGEVSTETVDSANLLIAVKSLELTSEKLKCKVIEQLKRLKNGNSDR